MGGSNLAPSLIKRWDPFIPIIAHKDYDLPDLAEEEFKESLIIASSYSGNTEETIDGFSQASKKGYARVAIAIGGTLLDLAKTEGVPYIEIPDTGIQPRSALGFSMKAMLAFMGQQKALEELTDLSSSLDPLNFQTEGKALAERLKGKIPLIYSSLQNWGVAYNWKIKFNETGKIPAFCNVFPELNHNEMNGFDPAPSIKALSERFYYLMLKDASDDPRISKRMGLVQKLYEDRGLEGEALALKGKSVFEKIFSWLLLADWASFYTAKGYNVEAEQVPMVEEFKERMRLP